MTYCAAVFLLICEIYKQQYVNPARFRFPPFFIDKTLNLKHRRDYIAIMSSCIIIDLLLPLQWQNHHLQFPRNNFEKIPNKYGCHSHSLSASNSHNARVTFSIPRLPHSPPRHTHTVIYTFILTKQLSQLIQH